MITNAYGPTSNNLKNDFILEMRTIACLHDLLWILLGDFNILRDPSESTSVNPNTHSMHDFNDMIIDLELHEIQLRGCSFTWTNKRPNPSFSKLDRVLLSNHWDSLTSHIPYLTDLPAPTSDHAPLILRFKIIDNHTYRSFSFQRHWLKYEEARDITRNAWESVPPSSNPTTNLIFRTKKVQQEMRS
jgi:hypothetical protein